MEQHIFILHVILHCSFIMTATLKSLRPRVATSCLLHQHMVPSTQVWCFLVSKFPYPQKLGQASHTASVTS